MKVIIMVLLLTNFTYAQRYKVLEGDIENIKGITEYNVAFDYSNIQIHGFDSEQDFLQDKMKKREHKEGAAEKFKDEWFSNRQNFYEPRFLDYFLNYFPNNEIVFQKASKAEYTMKIHSTWVYPGYLVEPAKLSANVSVFETKNPTKVLVVLQFQRVIGIENKQFNNELADRISSAYEKLAKNIAIQLKRFVK